MKAILLSLTVLFMTVAAHAGAIADHPLEIKDAGIVLLNGSIPILFERLGLQKAREFVSHEHQIEAVHYLEEVASGWNTKDDSLLALDKILCGIPVTTFAPADLKPTSEQKNIIENLITATIHNWPAVGSASLDGFRRNWLERPGTLVEKSDYWELTVEHRAYDVLLIKFPYSFSIIKYPWMTKPLHVIWKY